MLGYFKKVTKIDNCRKDEPEEETDTETEMPEISLMMNSNLTIGKPQFNCSVTSPSVDHDQSQLSNLNENCDDEEITESKSFKRRSLFKKKNFLPQSTSTSARRNRQLNLESSQMSSDESNSCNMIELSFKEDLKLPTISSHQNTNPTATFCPTIASALWRPLWPPGWHPRSSSSTVQTGSSQNQNFDVDSAGNTRSLFILDNKNIQKSKRHQINYLTTAESFSKMSKTGNKSKNSKHKSPIIGSDGTNHVKNAPHTVVNGDNMNYNYLNANKFNIFNKEDYEKIEDWLDEHPEFVHSYVVRKVSRSLIDKWLLSHSSLTTVGTLFANPNLTSKENSGSNTPVRKISAHEFEATGGGYLRPMVSTTCDGTPTFLPVQDFEAKNECSLKNQIMPINSSKDVSQVELENDYDSSRESSLSCIRSRSSIISIKSREELESFKDEKELIFELVKDICNDLDVKSLCHKILKNVSILTNADRCSLFLVRGEKVDMKSRYLVSQLFDVCGQSTIEQVSQNEEIIIPWGTGIVGHVAESGMAVNIPDCYQDSRFTNIIDQKTGYKTKNMLCNPVFDFNGEVMGVAQVINKKNSECFNRNDENVFSKYLQFCGIGLRNAQIYERSQLENKRNQVLLDLARMVFEKQSNIENIIYRILIHILSLLQCERCQIMLIADDESEDYGLFYYSRSYLDSYTDYNIESSKLRVTHSNVDGSPSECTSSNASTTSESSYDLIGNRSSFSNQTRSFYRVFDLQADDLQQPDFEKTRQTPFEGRFPINIGITGHVATTGETLNIPDAYSDSRFDPIVDQNGFRHKSILCMPIKNATRKIIGVAQLVNKLNKRPFNKNDENLFEAFAIFSGMGIENTHKYEKAVKAMAKQKVTLELLSYHASANDQEASKFARMLIPSTSSLSLFNLRFDDFSLNEDQMIKACIRMFIDLDLIERFHIDYKVLCKWILSVRKNYRPVLYHNWRHAFNVAQMMFAIFVNTNMCLVLGELETMALIVACLCHDLDHRGTNNSFQIKTSSPLAQLYSTSTLEHHHFDQSLMILNSQGNQILSNLSPEEYRRVVHVLEEAILATDLAVYFRKRDKFFELVDKKTYDWSDESHRSLLRSMLMTCCDIAAITKPWEIQKVVAELVASEFYQQGDIEKEQLNIEPIDMMNREKKDELPKMQMAFIDTICLPIYESFAKLSPQQMKILLKGVCANREAWYLLSSQPYQINIRQACEINNNNADKA